VKKINNVVYCILLYTIGDVCIIVIIYYVERIVES